MVSAHPHSDQDISWKIASLKCLKYLCGICFTFSVVLMIKIPTFE